MTRKNISLIGVVIAILITSYFLILNRRVRQFSTGPFPLSWSIPLPTDDTSFGGIFHSPYINDSLPYYSYRKIEDSIKRIKTERESDNNSGGSGRSIGGIGVFEINKADFSLEASITQKDSLLKKMLDSVDVMSYKMDFQSNQDSLGEFKKQIGEIMFRYNVRNRLLHQEHRNKQQKKYYIGLDSYSLEYNTKFFIDKETYNLAYVKWDSIIKRSSDSTKVGHYERKQIKVRYSQPSERILIPISKKSFDTMNIFLDIFSVLRMFLFFYFFIGLPIQILISISRGYAFTRKNISRLKLISYALAIHALLKTFWPYLIRFNFRNIIPDDFQSPPLIYSLEKSLVWYFMAITVFLVAVAFNRGYKLQQEQDLTV